MTTDLLLKQYERERFAGWLEREAETERALALAIKGLPTGPEIGAQLAKSREEYASACALIAARLRNTHDG